eukprot:580116-Hanusia_phi.AAC.1
MNMFGPTAVTVHVRKRPGQLAKPRSSSVSLSCQDLQGLLAYKQSDAAKMLVDLCTSASMPVNVPLS